MRAFSIYIHTCNIVFCPYNLAHKSMCVRWGHEQDIEERNANRTDKRMNEQANERMK